MFDASGKLEGYPCALISGRTHAGDVVALGYSAQTTGAVLPKLPLKQQLPVAWNYLTDRFCPCKRTLLTVTDAGLAGIIPKPVLSQPSIQISPPRRIVQADGQTPRTESFLHAAGHTCTRSRSWGHEVGLLKFRVLRAIVLTNAMLRCSRLESTALHSGLPDDVFVIHGFFLYLFGPPRVAFHRRIGQRIFEGEDQ